MNDKPYAVKDSLVEEEAAGLGCKFEVLQKEGSDFVIVRLRNEQAKFVRSRMITAKGYQHKVYPSKVDLLTSFKTATRGSPAGMLRV